MNENQTNDGTQSTFKTPETVQDLISLLKTFQLDHRISFSPFNLQRVDNEEDVVHFKMQETEGEHFEMLENLNG